jgi:exodeoxyribonuclease-3
MLRIITVNLNGMRSVCTKGFRIWLVRWKTDVVWLQEMKAHEGELTRAMTDPGTRLTIRWG